MTKGGGPFSVEESESGKRGALISFYFVFPHCFYRSLARRRDL